MKGNHDICKDCNRKILPHQPEYGTRQCRSCREDEIYYMEIGPYSQPQKVTI